MISHPPIPTVVSPLWYRLAPPLWQRNRHPNGDRNRWTPRCAEGLPRVSWRLVGVYFSLLDKWQLIVDDWIWLVGSRFLPFTFLQKFRNSCEENPFWKTGGAWAKKAPRWTMVRQSLQGITFRCRNNHNNAMKIISPAKIWSFKKLSATKTIQSLWFQKISLF